MEPKEPTIGDLLARVEAAEKRANAAEELAAAAVAAAGADAISKLESRLTSQAELDQRYREVRERNMRTLREQMPDARFRALAKGEADIAKERDALKERVATLEALVLEQHQPAAKKK